jgi:uncharacterized protein YbaP (TraB family)
MPRRSAGDAMRVIQTLLFAALLPTTFAAAQAPAEVLVTGEHPGPALWKVTSAQHVLWILGEPPTPLPDKLVWRSKQVETAMADSQEVILDGRIVFDTRTLRGEPLLNEKYRDMRTLPGGQTLKNVVSEDLYRRFRALKDAFAAKDDKIEHLRPWAAAVELRQHVLESLQLTNAAIIRPVLRDALKANVTQVVTHADFVELQRNSKGGRTEACLEATVTALETHRDDLWKLANAWSVGDIEALRELVPRQKAYVCLPAMFDSDPRAKDVVARHTEDWLAAADHALRTRQTSFALVPMEELVTADGWLAALRARGYQVEEPR